MSRIQILALSLSASVVVVGGVLAWQGLLPGVASFQRQSQSQTQDPAPLAAKPAATPAPLASPPADQGATRSSSKQPAEQQPILPQFDTVRVEPSGDVVVAGHGAAGAQIALIAGTVVLGEAGADAGGDFVILPQALAPGHYVLALRSQLGAAKPVMSQQMIVVTVPAKGQMGVVAAAAEPGTQSECVPDEPMQNASPAPPAQRASVAAASVPDPGRIIVGQTGTAKVTPGDSLWRISRKTLGEGVRYSSIYQANSSQIRDPNLIYPGQVFVVPH
jgi:nucleoid-associated protein YgaU